MQDPLPVQSLESGKTGMSKQVLKVQTHSVLKFPEIRGYGEGVFVGLSC